MGVIGIERKELQRKHPRLKKYNYSSAGAYFVTICSQDKQCIFSHISEAQADGVKIVYSNIGRIAEKQLLLLEERYLCLTVDCYVIMPNHIHVIFRISNNEGESDINPTIMDIVCTYKSLTARECKNNGFTGKLFQTSFYEHVIRGRSDYEQIVKYIFENPLCWYYDELNKEK